MMELRFAVCNMNLPLVVVVVGTGDKWKRSEVRVHDEYIEKFSTKQNLYSIFNGAFTHLFIDEFLISLCLLINCEFITME